MRKLWLVFSLPLLLLAFPDDAMAAKKGKGKSKGKKGKSAKKKKKKKKLKIQKLGYKSLDKVFAEVKLIDERLTRDRKILRSGRFELNKALGLAQGTPLKEGIKALKRKSKGKTRVQMLGSAAVLKPASNAASDVQAATEAVNKMSKQFPKAIKDLRQIPKDSQRLIKKTKAMPNKLKEEFKKKMGGDPIALITQLPKTAKILKNNIKITTALPVKAKETLQEMTAVAKMLKNFAN